MTQLAADLEREIARAREAAARVDDLLAAVLARAWALVAWAEWVRYGGDAGAARREV